MEFKKFPSLENTYRQKEIDQALMVSDYYKQNGKQTDWIVTEKVHGANFSFWLSSLDDSINIQVAKRSGLIESDEKFFNYRSVLEKYSKTLISMYEKLGCKTLVVYGELFGGNIQSGMPYQLDQDFVAFDVIVDGIAQKKTEIFSTLRSFNIPVVPVIGIFNTLKDALDTNESFDSLLSRNEFDGKIEHKEAEGLVIEPNDPMYAPNGSRIYLKKKTKRFLEKGGNQNAENKIPTTLSDQVRSLMQSSAEYITESRFQSVVSKIGEVSIKDIGKVMGLMTQDIIEDVEKDYSLDIKSWFKDKQDSKIYSKHLMRSVQDFIKPILLEM